MSVLEFEARKTQVGKACDEVRDSARIIDRDRRELRPYCFVGALAAAWGQMMAIV